MAKLDSKKLRWILLLAAAVAAYLFWQSRSGQHEHGGTTLKEHGGTATQEHGGQGSAGKEHAGN